MEISVHNENIRRGSRLKVTHLETMAAWLGVERGKTKRFEFAKANLDAKKTSGGELKANLTHFFSRHFLILLSRFFFCLKNKYLNAVNLYIAHRQ